jgi:hypothetical protein
MAQSPKPSNAPSTAAEVRRTLVDTLGLDLVGPERGSALIDETLPQTPSRWYLTGFLAPIDAAEEQKADLAQTEEMDELSDSGGIDDAAIPEPAAARRVVFPSSMGLSLLVPKDAKELRVTILWGDYQPLGPVGQEGADIWPVIVKSYSSLLT